MPAYCAYADILAQVGTPTPPQATVEALIADAGRRINSKLKARGLQPNYTADELITAAIAMSTAKVATLLRMSNVKPNSLTLASGMTMSDNVDNIIKQLEAEAAEQIELYIQSSQGSGSDVEQADRVDSDQTEYHLDQSRRST